MRASAGARAERGRRRRGGCYVHRPVPETKALTMDASPEPASVAQNMHITTETANRAVRHNSFIFEWLGVRTEFATSPASNSPDAFDAETAFAQNEHKE